MAVLFVEYPKCSTCKRAKAWLDEHGVEYVDRDIVADNPTAEELAAWVARSGLPVRRFFNSSGMKYRELGLKARLDAGMTDQECFELLATDGMLVRRPLLVGDVLRFPALKRPFGPRRCCSRRGKRVPFRTRISGRAFRWTPLRKLHPVLSVKPRCGLCRQFGPG